MLRRKEVRRIITFDKDVRLEYDELDKVRAEFRAQKIHATREIEQARLNRGFAIIEGFDTDEYTSQIRELRERVETLEDGLQQVEMKLNRMRAAHHWLKG